MYIVSAQLSVAIIIYYYYYYYYYYPFSLVLAREVSL